MKCQNCNQEISDEAVFCPHCGTATSKSGKQEVDDLHFIPTTVAKLRPFSFADRLLFGGLMLLAIFLIIPTFGISLIVLLLFLFPMRMGAKVFPMIFVHKKLCAQSDYIQDPGLFKTERYIRIKKDGKLGLYDQKRQMIQLPGVYEKLAWDMKDRTLDVIKDGARFKIDIFGNPLK